MNTKLSLVFVCVMSLMFVCVMRLVFVCVMRLVLVCILTLGGDALVSSGIMESLLQVLEWRAFEPTNITVSTCLY